MEILVFSRYYEDGASSRIRFHQYEGLFKKNGFLLTFAPFFSENYIESLYTGRVSVFDLLLSYLKRMWWLCKVRRYDVVLIEKELFPGLPAIFEYILRLAHIKVVVDFDDATFHTYDQHRFRVVRRLLGNKIASVIRNATSVVVGNGYLREYALRYNSEVTLIPSVVDDNRYEVRRSRDVDQPVIVGWIGTPKTCLYLKPLMGVFEVLQSRYNVKFVAVGADQNVLETSVVKVIPWSDDTEVMSIQQFDVGIMPLFDQPFERGKCGFKLVQYMACAIPVVASPVGVNVDLVESEVNGMLADTEEQWFEALSYLVELSRDELRQMGLEGRRRVESWYCVGAQAPRFESVIERAAR